MVSEIILCVKEVNQKTRTAAYELLVSLAGAMHEQHLPPMPLMGEGQDADMDTGGCPSMAAFVSCCIGCVHVWLHIREGIGSPTCFACFLFHL